MSAVDAGTATRSRSEADPDNPETRFSWNTQRREDCYIIQLAGHITLADSPTLWKRIRQTLDEQLRVRMVEVDLAQVHGVDGASMALLAHLRTQLLQRQMECEFSNADEDVQQVVDLYGGAGKSTSRHHEHRTTSAIEQIGRATVETTLEAKQLFSFLGQLVLSSFGTIRRPRSVNLGDIGVTMERAGADAAPIILLINFLIGFVMAYQSSEQLIRFGTNIYVVDLIAVSMTRELGPLMTAIIVCGRTGAAFTAELGTMKVSEEIDALRTLGFLPLRYLVMPRMLGLMLVMPLLVLLADVVGVLGGLVVGAWLLEVTPIMFLSRLETELLVSDVASGLVKAVVFSAAIAIITCQQGLATSGGASGVGRRTTGAVVATLFALILLDAAFTVLLQSIGL